MEDYANNDYMIAWDSAPSRTPMVHVGLHPDRMDWSIGYQFTTGCCDAAFIQMGEQEQAQALVNLAAMLVLGDGIPPQSVLKEFAKIRVWREMGLQLPHGHYDSAFLPGDYTVLNPYNANLE